MSTCRSIGLIVAGSFLVISLALSPAPASAALGLPLFRPFSGTHYLGTVTTIPINLPGEPFATPWGPITYDSKRATYDLAYYNSMNQNALIVR